MRLYATISSCTSLLLVNGSILLVQLVLGVIAYGHLPLVALSDKTLLYLVCGFYLLGIASNLLLMVRMILNNRYSVAIAYGVAVVLYLLIPFLAMLVMFGSYKGPHGV